MDSLVMDLHKILETTERIIKQGPRELLSKLANADSVAVMVEDKPAPGPQKEDWPDEVHDG